MYIKGTKFIIKINAFPSKLNHDLSSAGELISLYLYY